MNNVIKKFAAFVVCAAASLAVAQTPKQVIPCAQVVRMNALNHLEKYIARTKNPSTAGHLNASAEFRRCRKEANDKAATQKLTPFRQSRLDALRGALDKIAKCGNAFFRIEAGGGTMFDQFLAFTVADRETFIANLIEILARPDVKDPAARNRANALFGASARRLGQMRAPKPGGDGANLSAEIADHGARWAQAQGARIRLLSLAAALPDRAAERIAQRLQTELEGSELEPR